MSRLVIIDGLSTVGKSTFSKYLSQTIDKTTPSIWIHEESLKHPIRDHEFEAGDIHTLEGMEMNEREMLSRWKTFSVSMQQNEAVYVIEGCYLHTLDRYLLQCAWSHEKIVDFLQKIATILSPLQPLLVLLYREDIFASYDIEFKKRGSWWENLISEPRDITGHSANILAPDEKSIYLRTPKYQQYLRDMLPLLPIDSMEIETSEGRWDDYLANVMSRLHIQMPSPEILEPFDPKRFVGKYVNDIFRNPILIQYNPETKKIFMTFFWPYMELRFVGEDALELISFPAKLQFVFDEDKQYFTISGNYDWEIDLQGRRFVKVSNYSL